ncbi:hypothetical protein SYNPS1DRAFT_26316 [Syncephalis pseudoplumigaleata]|uniref:Mediator of RNA polymerase II transcription subunit 16 n=1 Tax=Syncephalis pseudoplumigaleata TaxID=1712513 RepID=A0A4P9Z7A9_9FUNG|nr:hypothetical protein SYNPS1DRAFT_26316 [Syncephalis pseudoplumigaleata]|eukprot:RKP28082.1 hypothetical protein SYNPS1DRAFT_26316 [Syncephalis pseudoplumigaleata]
MIDEVRQAHRQHDVVFARWAEHGRALFTVDAAQCGVLWQCTHALNSWKPVYKMRFSSPLLAHAWLSTERQYAGTFEDGILTRLHRLPWMGPRNPWGGHAFMTLSATGQIAVYYQETRDKYQSLHGDLIDPADDGTPPRTYLAGDICLWSDGQAVVSVVYHDASQWHQSVYRIAVDFDQAQAITSHLLWSTTIDHHALGVTSIDATPSFVFWTRLAATSVPSNAMTLLTLISPIDHAIDASQVMLWQLDNMHLSKETAFSLPGTLVTSCDMDRQGKWWCIGTVDGRLELRPFDTTANAMPALSLPTDQAVTTAAAVIASTRVQISRNQQPTDYVWRSRMACVATTRAIPQDAGHPRHQFPLQYIVAAPAVPIDTAELAKACRAMSMADAPSTNPIVVISVCALDKVKRMNIQFIIEYSAALAKWDACMQASSADCSDLPVGMVAALAREAIWIVEAVLFLLRDMHGTLTSLKFGTYNRQNRPYSCSLLFHPTIRANLARLLGYVQSIMQYHASKPASPALTPWIHRLEGVFGYCSIKLDDMHHLLATELPSRLARLNEDEAASVLGPVILAQFTLPASITASDEWAAWAKEWYERHASVQHLYQYTPTMTSPFAACHAVTTTAATQSVGIATAYDRQDWSLWRDYFTHQQDQLTRLPLTASTDDIRVCIRCAQPAACPAPHTNDWPMFNEHCPCGGAWWRVPPTSTSTSPSTR